MSSFKPHSQPTNPEGDTALATQQVSTEQLEAAVRGAVITPGDSRYDDARRVYNAQIDKRPAVIVQCVDDADVAATVNFARDNDLGLSIRGGSHNPNGFAVNDDGVVIDLRLMNSVHVDPATKTVRVQGGCVWGDVDHATHQFGLAVPSGIISTTGVAGLALGGGIGYLTRKAGLTCDNLISADVITADGNRLTASANENDDLYWALRGGGGNFGVVTSFEFQAHDVHTVFGGPFFYDVKKGTEVMKLFRDFIMDAPDDMTAFFAYLIVPPADPFPTELQNKTVAAIICAWTGPLEKGPEMTQPLRDFGPPLMDGTAEVPFPALNSAFDGLVPEGLQHYWKADFVDDLTDPLIATHAKHGPNIPTFESAMHIYPVNGAAHRVGKTDTAWSYREANFTHVIAAMFPDPADTDANREWVRNYWDELSPNSSGGAYVNFMHEEDQERIKASYRDNYDRLARVKAKYDPSNLFHINQNIQPA
ncbi:MAG: FAD-binding oxidoreductase [Chloroflexi bacterium]|nr:FAD-binding oxidoreductase [Chloroflexota bacterium]MCI0885791.1 FAD-binding oxidoreductase [Chloroflexota bacterium]